MILVDNRNILRLKDRKLLNHMSLLDDRESTGDVIVEQAKTGVPTIKISIDGRTQYLQSKYDPEREAERFAGKFDDEAIKHVLFVGVGLGYHIQKFMEVHPDAKFSIYEPNEEVFHAYLSNIQLDALPIRNLEKVFVGTDEEQVESEVQQLLAASNNVLKIITLPVYEKIYGPQINAVLEKALESLKDRHNSLATNAAFQKRWTINSITNFPTVLKTPNILHDIDRSAIEGKPAIIVAAGPSLNEEFENLRYIKEHGLAYIFSVGSAINALIEQGIYPDAACTYDPQDINYRVIQVIKDKGIKEIPLVFGSSVGFETLDDYPGEMFHMIVNQDTIAPAFLKKADGTQLDFVNDAPSIAVVTFQLLVKLGVSQIILVGQNLAYIANQHYAKGIDYGNGTSEISEEALNKALIIKDVYGNDVKTTDGFNRMRQQLEMYIAQSPDITVWNTTKGGATIKGAGYKELNELISEQLKAPVYQSSWTNGNSKYDTIYLENKINEMNTLAELADKEINKVFDTLRAINKDVELKRTTMLEKRYTQLDHEMGNLKSNLFYKAFIEPMIRVQHEQLVQKIQDVRYEKKAMKKGETILREFTAFIAECARHYKFSLELYKEMKDKINLILN